MKRIQFFTKIRSGSRKASLQDLMITTRQIRRATHSACIILLMLIFGGCHQAPSTDVKDLLDLPYGSVFVIVRCAQIDKNDTMEICCPFQSLEYCLEEDSITQPLCDRIEDFVLNGEVLFLPEKHALLQNTIIPDLCVDSVYKLGYNHLLQQFFFTTDELKKETSCYLDRLHSACGNSVYFGHKSTPCYYREGDSIMDDYKQKYIISLLYKNNIFCMLDENGNICLLNCNLKREDIIHIPFPVVECR